MKAAGADQYINQHFTLACEKMFNCTGKVVVMGMGKSRSSDGKIAATFARPPAPLPFCTSGRSRARRFGDGYAAECGYRYLNSGESADRRLIPVLKRLHVPLICITGRRSSMARAADDCICVLKCPRSVSVRRGAYRYHRNAGDGRYARRGVVKARGFTPKISLCRITAARWDVATAARKRY